MGDNIIDIRLFSASYHRSRSCITHRIVPDVTYVVDESEAESYRKTHSRVHACPDGVQGSLARVRNYILDMCPGDTVVLLDDDITAIGRFNQCKAEPLSPFGILAMIEQGTILALDMDVRMWGVQVSPDTQNYREYKPFGLVNYIGGPFSAHVNSPLRYDEAMFLKEDYDLSLQHLNRYRRILRLNMYYYAADLGGSGGGLTGGVASIRTVEAEKQQNKALQKKWGSKIIRFDSLKSSRSHSSTKVRNFDINPIMNCPIREG